jgi:ER lumen protein retaining receptor
MDFDSSERQTYGNKVKDIISDPNNLLFELQKKKKDVIFWLGILTLIFVVYFTLSSGEFSFILVLSSITQMASFLIIAMKVYYYQNVSGLSLNSMICYFIVMVARLTSTIFYSGYLPSDEAGDWFYQLCEVFSLILVIINIFFITKLYKETSENETEDSVDYKYLTVPAIILALLVHTSLNRNILTDVAWSFSMYLEGMAIFPQLHLFRTKGGQIETYTSHYVSLQGISRLFTLMFWWYTYEELNEEAEDSFSFFHTYTGYFIIFSQIIQIILMADFYYFYFKSLFKGEKMSISSEI